MVYQTHSTLVKRIIALLNISIKIPYLKNPHLNKANHFFKHVVQHSALDDEDAYVNDLLDMLLGGLS